MVQKPIALPIASSWSFQATGQSGRGEAAMPYLFRGSDLLGIPTFLRSIDEV